MTGKLIVFEGLDGAGKTTQLELFANTLRQAGYDVVITCEPGGTVLGDEVRALVKKEGRANALSANTMLMLFAASFAQKWHEILKPALDSGKIVISDRLWFSTLAYQGYALGLDPAYVRQVCLAAFDNRMPDAAFFFDLDPKERATRLAGRGGTDAIESLGNAFFERVRSGYHTMAANGDLTIIDASGAPDEVQKNLLASITQVMPDLVLTATGTPTN